MMGERRVAQKALFYDFSLERHDRVVDLSGVRTPVRRFCNETGRPSVPAEHLLSRD